MMELPLKFFSQEAMTATAIAKFAIKFKCTIIPAYCIRLCLELSLKLNTLNLLLIKIKKLGTEKKILLFLNKYVEDWIKKYPEQWIWIHNRWKN